MLLKDLVCDVFKLCFLVAGFEFIGLWLSASFYEDLFVSVCYWVCMCVSVCVCVCLRVSVCVCVCL